MTHLWRHIDCTVQTQLKVGMLRVSTLSTWSWRNAMKGNITRVWPSTWCPASWSPAEILMMNWYSTDFAKLVWRSMMKFCCWKILLCNQEKMLECRLLNLLTLWLCILYISRVIFMFKIANILIASGHWLKQIPADNSNFVYILKMCQNMPNY